MKALSILSILAIISGCAGVGEKEFTCPGMSGGATCMGVRDVYSSTNAGQLPKPNVMLDEDQLSSTERDPRKENSISSETNSTQEVGRVTDPVIDTFVAPRLPDKPVPIRTPAVVMRIKVYAFEDAKTGVLFTPGYIFSEIEPRRWTIGSPESAAEIQSRLLTPLRADPRE